MGTFRLMILGDTVQHTTGVNLGLIQSVIGFGIQGKVLLETQNCFETRLHSLVKDMRLPYRAHEFKELLNTDGIVSSMDDGEYDVPNAVDKSFFGNLTWKPVFPGK